MGRPEKRRVLNADFRVRVFIYEREDERHVRNSQGTSQGDDGNCFSHPNYFMMIQILKYDDNNQKS